MVFEEVKNTNKNKLYYYFIKIANLCILRTVLFVFQSWIIYSVLWNLYSFNISSTVINFQEQTADSHYIKSVHPTIFWTVIFVVSTQDLVKTQLLLITLSEKKIILLT